MATSKAARATGTQEKRKAESEAAAWTIDELARQTGVTTRNIRAYHSKGLLPAPRLVGRTGYYDDRHVHRLQAVTRLIERGFSIVSIRSLLTDWERGNTLSDALGIEDVRTYGGELRLQRAEVERLFPDMKDEVVLDQAVNAGLFRREADTLVLPNPVLVEVGLKLIQAGVPLPVALRSFELLVRDLRGPAERYIKMLFDHVLGSWSPSASEPAPPELEERLSAWVPLARVAVASTFARELRTVLTEELRHQGEACRTAPKKSSPKRSPLTRKPG